MILVDYTLCFKELDRYVKETNSTTEEIAEKVRQSVYSTAKEIIRIYGAFLIKVDAVKEVDAQNPPGLRTNNVQLATLTNASTRTIQRHIAKLIKVNIIIKKKWRGTNGSYELWLNPEILLVRCKKIAREVQKSLLNKKEEKSEKQEVKKGGRTKWRHTDTSNTSNTNNAIIAVEKLETSKRCGPPPTSIDSGNEHGNNSGNTGGKDAQISIVTGGKDSSFRAENGEMNASEYARTTALKKYVDEFWELAKVELYKNRYLTDWQIQTAKKLIWKLYEPIAPDKMKSVHQHYCNRIRWQAYSNKYNAKAKFVLLPDQYFDTENQNGFVGTKWRYHLFQVNREVKHYQNNLLKPVEKQVSRLELYLSSFQRIGKLGNPDLLKIFQTKIIEINKAKTKRNEK